MVLVVVVVVVVVGSSRSASCRSSSRVVEVGEGGPAGFGSEKGRGAG